MINRSLAPSIKPFDNVRFDFPKPQVLNNGIPIYIVNRGEEDVNRLSLHVRGGVLDETRSMESTLTASTALEGSRWHNSEQIAQCLDFNGGWKATQTYDDWSELSLWSLNEHFDETLPIFVECIADPTFLPQDFQLLQRRMAGTCAMIRQKVKNMAAEELRRMFYGADHPLSVETTPEGIMAIEPSHLLDFHRRFYHTSDMIAIISGRITDKEMSLVDRLIGHLDMPGAHVPKYDWSQFQVPTAGCMSVVDKPDAVQSAIAIALPAVPRRHPHYIKLRVLATVFGGYFGSRLMATIREDKGYTYGIHAALAGREHTAYVVISTECATRYTWAVIDEIKNEMKRLREQPVMASEIETVKQHMMSELVKTLDTPFSMASYVASTITYGIYPEYYNEQVAQITAITAADLQEMAQLYLREDLMLISVAGNRSALGR